MALNARFPGTHLALADDGDVVMMMAEWERTEAEEVDVLFLQGG